MDAQRNLLYVKGHVPGHKGNFVLVRDAVFKHQELPPELPFPTLSAELPTLLSVAPAGSRDPFAYAD